MSEYSITGYESFHKNGEHKKGDEVIYYIKNTLPAVKIEKQGADKYDSVYVDIITERNRKLSIGAVYRPPKLQAADDTALFEEINSITQNKEAIIIGDFNCPSVDCRLMHGEQEGNRLVEMIEYSIFTQIVNHPTRENNIIYLVLVTNPDLYATAKLVKN